MKNFDMRDVHIYGGMLLVGGGVLALGGWPASLIAVGMLSRYLGTFRMGRL